MKNVQRQVLRGSLVMHKFIPKHKYYAQELFTREVTALKRLDACKHVIRLVHDEESDEGFHVYTEYAPGGTLMHSHKADLPHIAHACLRGLQETHAASIVHGDIKPANIVFNTDNLQLIDFGDCHFMDDLATLNKPAHHLRGTVPYMAPETLRSKYGPQCDVWSLGVTLYNTWTGKLAFNGRSVNTVWKRIIDEEPDYGAVEDPFARDFISKCLVKDPARRATVDELLEHQWVQLSRCELSLIG